MNDALNVRQSNAHALELLAAVQALEHGEQPARCSRIESGAVVADEDHRLAIVTVGGSVAPAADGAGGGSWQIRRYTSATCSSSPSRTCRKVPAWYSGDWSMGFVDVGGGAAALPGFRPGRSLADLSGDAATIERIVAGFRDGRWQRAMNGPGGL
jgi:hypothetical protein